MIKDHKFCFLFFSNRGSEEMVIQKIQATPQGLSKDATTHIQKSFHVKLFFSIAQSSRPTEFIYIP
jgi:hypothetical protein